MFFLIIYSFNAVFTTSIWSLLIISSWTMLWNIWVTDHQELWARETTWAQCWVDNEQLVSCNLVSSIMQHCSTGSTAAATLNTADTAKFSGGENRRVAYSGMSHHPTHWIVQTGQNPVLPVVQVVNNLFFANLNAWGKGVIFFADFNGRFFKF